jgi:Protein of unknown function (DUF2845)
MVMDKRLLLAGLAVVLIAAKSSTDSMRCGNRIVGTGDHQAKVRALCGEPDDTDSRKIYRAGLPRRDWSSDDTNFTDEELLIHNRSLVEVEVEVWLFNQGPRRLMREVVFHDNKVVAVNVLGYGY